MRADTIEHSRADRHGSRKFTGTNPANPHNKQPNRDVWILGFLFPR